MKIPVIPAKGDEKFAQHLPFLLDPKP